MRASSVVPQHADGVFAPWSPLRFWRPPGATGGPTAVRVTFTALPAPFDAFNGQSMWVGEPREVSENGGSIDPIPAAPNFWAATLTCEPFYTDWSALGRVAVYHELIVPQGSYDVQVVREGCGLSSETNFSPALSLATAAWGDTIENCATRPCAPPDGAVNINDVTAILERFVSNPISIVKARADLEPATVDLVVNISDVLFSLTGFQGIDYPFAPPLTDPCAP